MLANMLNSSVFKYFISSGLKPSFFFIRPLILLNRMLFYTFAFAYADKKTGLKAEWLEFLVLLLALLSKLILKALKTFKLFLLVILILVPLFPLALFCLYPYTITKLPKSLSYISLA